MTHQVVNDGTLTSPQGFSVGATFVDIKAWKEKPFDLAILHSEIPCVIAGVFTTNKIKAAPVILCKDRVSRGSAQALIVNSGCANACTAERGLSDAEQMAYLTATKLGLAPADVLVASTGVIGTNLPMDRIERGIERIEFATDGGHDFAQAIMTTDTHSKEIAVQININGKSVKIGAMAKGAGMIFPNMSPSKRSATMLAFITTDANIDKKALRESL